MKNKVKYLQLNNITPLIKEYCKTFKTPAYIEERINIFLTHLYLSQLNKRYLSITDKRRYTPITVEFLIVYLSDANWKATIDMLVDNNIIELNRDEKTIYSHINNKGEEVTYNTYRFKIINFELYKNHTKKSQVTWANNKKIYDNLYQMKHKGICGDIKKIITMECKHNIDITEEEFYKESVNYYPSYVKKKIAKGETEKKFDIWYEEDMLSKYKLITLWNDMSLKDRKLQNFVKVDKFGNRKHTIFTLLPSFCRKYISGFGKDIVEMDLHQSQPTIFNRVLVDRGVESKFNEILSSYDNDIYDYYTPDNNIPRTVKKSLLFGGIFVAHGAPAFLKFEKIFTEEAKMMRKLQQGLTLTYTGTSKIIPKHKNIPCLLQRKESEIFKQIWIKLINKRIKFISVHDAIYCNSEDYDMVKRTMTFALNKELGKNNWNFNK